MHVNMRCVQPWVEEKEFRFDPNNFGFICTGVRNADSYKRNQKKYSL